MKTYKWNVADYDDSKAGIEKVESELGPIEIVVANAGITRDAPFHKMSPEQWKEVIDTNLTGVFNTIHPVWPGMRERKFGRVVVISSVNGQKGQFAQVNYAATKAGDIGIVRSLAQEGARAGITANVVAPGYIATEMVMAVPEKVRESIIGQIPAGRLGEPEEIARCVAFLVSDEAGFVNGSTISANGAQFFS
ncbi:MAG: beta-ketoacyl-ACP reductase [Dinoroseobacter sp.]|nr:beta-ketoacyl-ACP reductase [Dinoroseobacter sp.]